MALSKTYQKNLSSSITKVLATSYSLFSYLGIQSIPKMFYFSKQLLGHTIQEMFAVYS